MPSRSTRLERNSVSYHVGEGFMPSRSTRLERNSLSYHVGEGFMPSRSTRPAILLLLPSDFQQDRRRDAEAQRYQVATRSREILARRRGSAGGANFLSQMGFPDDHPGRGGRRSKEAQSYARLSQHQRYRLYVDKSGSTVASYLHFFPVTSSPFSFSSCLSQMHYPLERVQRIRNLVTPSWQGCILPTSSTALLLW